MGPLTGPSSSFGTGDRNSAVLAIEDYNQKHPDCKVTLVDFDTQGSADKAPAAAQKAIQDQQIVAMLGPEFSGENQAALPIFEQAGMPTVTSDATNGDLSSHGWKVFHRTVASDSVEGPGEAVWTVQNAGLKSIAVIDNGQAYGQGIAKTYAAAVPRVGGKVATTASINASASDYSSTVVAVKGSGADAVYCGCLYAEAARLLKQLRQGGVSAQFISDAGAIQPDFGKLAGESSAEGSVAGQTGVINGQNAVADALFKKYVQRFGADAPQTYVAEGYDAANAILMAIAAGKHSRSSINSYLSTVSFDGASGHIQFKSNGDRTTADMNMMKYTSGKWAFLTNVKVPQNLLSQ
jgi:branched-chain amino acid transport system substrate-binding protein